MSYAVLALCGITASQPGVAASLLGALSDACNLRQPIGRFAVLITPEHARLVSRISLVAEWHEMELFWLAKKLARRSARGDELLIIAIGEEDGPRFRTISLAPVRSAFVAAARAGKEQN